MAQMDLMSHQFDKPLYYLNFQGSSWPDTILDSTSTVFYSFIGLDIPVEPKQISGRILCLSICLTGAILFWSYSAGLVSFLTFEKYNFPIKSLQVSRIRESSLKGKDKYSWPPYINQFRSDPFQTDTIFSFLPSALP